MITVLNMSVPPDMPQLRDLLKERPRTKMGQIKAVWPQIEQALRAGHTLKAVWERLQSDGIQIHYNRLSEYVGRLRRREHATTTTAGPAPPPAEKGNAVDAPQLDQRGEERDPAANLRERLGRPTG
ncbi:MAG: hypothetical protein EPN40_04065, partial [Rhodanobacteraceae bacterium]